MEYFALALIWSVWCVIHSAMISLPVHGYLKKRLGYHYKFYRLFYNLFALATLFPIILYSQSIKNIIIFRWEGYMAIVQLIFLIIAMSLFISGGLKYDLLQFLGIKQIKSDNSYSTLSASGDLDVSGIFGLTRQPWYLAAIIFVWVSYRDMYLSTLIVNIILTIYLITGTILEEGRLIIELGDDYRAYKDKVSMLFPVKWLLSKL